MSKQEECPLEPLTVYNIIGMKCALDDMRRNLAKTIEDIDFRLAEYKHHMDCHEKVLQDMKNGSC